MRQVARNGEVFALIVTEADFQPGVHFVSPPDWPFQLGVMEHPPGHTIEAHAHRVQAARVISVTQEFLMVLSGKMQVDFYDLDGTCFHTEIVGEREALLQFKGGHGFHFLEPTRVLEVKQGPFQGRETDKQKISPR